MATLAGTARTASDPTFAKAKIAPYEVDVTSYVDRNLGRLNPADYAAKIQTMALRALRRKINGLIVNGDGQTSPDMYGITTAKNTAGTASGYRRGHAGQADLRLRRRRGAGR